MNPSDKYSVLNNALFSMPLSPFKLCAALQSSHTRCRCCSAVCVCVVVDLEEEEATRLTQGGPVAAKMFRRDDEGWEEAAVCVSMQELNEDLEQLWSTAQRIPSILSFLLPCTLPPFSSSSSSHPLFYFHLRIRHPRRNLNPFTLSQAHPPFPSTLQTPTVPTGLPFPPLTFPVETQALSASN